MPIHQKTQTPNRRMTTISLVVSSYNQIDLLKVCLRSIAAQSRPFDEVIVVDDASTDGSQRYLEDWVQERPEHRLMKSAVNGGLSATRNQGMAAASMDYVAFIDGDDWFEPSACESMVGPLQRAAPDVVFFGFNSFDQSRGEVVQKTHGSGYYTQAPLTCARPRTEEEISQLFRLIPAMWMKFYRRAFLSDNQIRSIGRLYEDTLWTLQCITQADDIYCISDRLINYRMHAGSFLHQCTDRHFSFFEISDKCEEFLSFRNDISPGLVTASRRFRFNLAANALLNTGRIPDRSKSRYAREILRIKGVREMPLDAAETELMARIEALVASE